MKFLCGRPGCGRESTATLQIDALGETVSLDEPCVTREGVAMCNTHADRTTPPVGWSMNDLRSTAKVMDKADSPKTRIRPSGEVKRRPGSRMSERHSIAARALRSTTDSDLKGSDGDQAAVIDLVEKKPSKSNKQSDKELLKQAKSKALAPDSRPSRRRSKVEDEPVATQEMFPWHYEFDEDDPPEGIKASSPLLSRAFRSTFGQ